MKNSLSAPVRILLADDNQHGLLARRMILQDQGFEVETATSGEEAWEFFQARHFDVVVTDYRMKQMNGSELITLIRTSGSAARVIMLSGFASAMGMTEASTGADLVIAKSNKEVPELVRGVKKLAHLPMRRGAGSAGSTAARVARKAG
jgi:CheY-like chemotaxis protein